MGLQSYVDGPYRTFTEEVAGSCTGKEGYLVELASSGNIQLFTSGNAIGVVHQKLQGSNDVTVRLLGKGGTVKMVQGGAIAVGVRVKGASGGKSVTEGSGARRCLGVKISPAANGADGDFMEVVDNVESFSS